MSKQKYSCVKKVRLFATCDVLTMPLRFALFASVMCAALAVRPSIEDHKNAQVKADVHEHIHSEPVEKSCCATWTAKTVDSPKHCWVKGSCFKWGQSSTARDYSAVDNEMCEGKDMCA